MPIPSLPPELTDEIIAWIPAVCLEDEEDSYPTLLSCCLVCRAWLPASRHQLFQVLSINSPERYDLLVSRVLQSEKMRVSLSYVRHVELDCFEDDPSWRRAFTLDFADHLPHVTHMSFKADHTVKAFMPHPSSFAALSLFSSIHTLLIDDCQFSSFGAFRRTLTFLPSLAHLFVDCPSWPEPAADLSPSLSYGAPAVARPTLLSLRIDWETAPHDRLCAQQFISWLSQTTTSLSLFHMAINDIHDLTSTFGPSLLQLGHGVRELDIFLEDEDPNERYLSGFGSLQRLGIHFQHTVQSDTWGQVEQLVHSLPSSAKLKRVYIAVLYRFSTDISIFNGVVALGTALEPEQFGALETVEIHVKQIRTQSHEGRIRAIIEKGLPQLRARNVLKVLFSKL